MASNIVSLVFCLLPFAFHLERGTWDFTCERRPLWAQPFAVEMGFGDGFYYLI